jgi:hypothetical protein
MLKIERLESQIIYILEAIKPRGPTRVAKSAKATYARRRRTLVLGTVNYSISYKP